MGLDGEGEDLHDVRVIKCYGEVGETVEMDWSTAKTGFYGS